MNRLNYFNYYESKQQHYEDNLTRSFMVLLNYSPIILKSFYGIVLEKLGKVIISNEETENYEYLKNLIFNDESSPISQFYYTFVL